MPVCISVLFPYQCMFLWLWLSRYTITSGSKFGGDYLLYPGDPRLYHAQFVVRVMSWQQVINPMQLKSWARGVHSARKHLLLATAYLAEEAQQGQPSNNCSRKQVWKPMYITVAKEAGFAAAKGL